jgi:multisubunit Na+/H+ antiporter MnhB subunit
VVSAINFDYRGFDTVGEEFILFTAAAGMSVVLRRLRGEHEQSPYDRAVHRGLPPTSDAVRVSALALAGPVALIGWWLASHAQTNPSGGFQGGVILASAFMLVYLSGEFLAFRRLSPVALLDGAEALGAGAFVAIGLAAVVQGLPYLDNHLAPAPLGQRDLAARQGPAPAAHRGHVHAGGPRPCRPAARRLPLLRRGYEPGTGLTTVTRRFQSGIINDYITWLVTGVAALGGILALIIR